jgi:tRNA modification GTPase
MNKVDLCSNNADMLAESAAVATSALTGDGLDGLRSAVLAQLHANEAIGEGAVLNNPRQLQALNDAVGALDAADTANGDGLPHEVLLVDLHGALRALDSLTGQTTTDDILGRIFSTFCIGK